LAYITILVFVGWLVIWTLGYFDITLDDIRIFSESIGIFGPLILIAATTASLIFSPLSSASIVALSVVMYGPTQGYIIGVIAGLLGGYIDYTIAYLYGKSFIQRFIGPKTLQAVTDQGEKIKKKGAWSLLLAMPLSLDLVSYAAGLVQFKQSHFAIALVFGVLVNTLAVVLLTTGVISISL
jgi:uncharacterized membrane protein YdjX (TVP38/TMEM64 family)